MATVKLEITTTAPPPAVWEAIADVGALHTRLVPGFVVDTQLEGSARIVTFGNGMKVREPIVTIDPNEHRLVWSADGAGADHYNASVQAFEAGEGSRVVWIADFLPNDVEAQIRGMMQQGIAVMKRTLDGLAPRTSAAAE